MALRTTTKEEAETTAYRRTLEGTVVRKSGDKTVSVEVTRVSRHSKYGKKMVTTKRYLAHDPDNAGVVGEAAVIREARPQSKRKRWMLVKSE